METNLITDEPLLICEFQNVRSRNPRPIRFGEFMERVCSPAYKEHVQNFRQLAADEATRAEAQRVKGDTPCVVITGNCREGHKVEHLVSFSGLLCIDLDHTDGRTAEIIRRVQSLPWVMAAFRSISGKGVKVVARVSTDDMRHRYAHLYAAVGSAVSACAEHPYDEKCKILTQPCYYSWDPDAFYRPDATPFRMPEPLKEDETLVPAPEAAVPASPKAEPKAEPGAGFLVQFIDTFERRNPFVRGGRNDCTLKLGMWARSKGFSQEELEKLIQMFSYRHAAEDFTSFDIRQRILAGYQYVSKTQNAEKGANRGHFGVRGHLTPIWGDASGDEKDEMLENNEALMRSLPLIPDEVYAALPDYLQRCVLPAGNAYERDFLLLGSLVSCSAALPLVRFRYKQVEYSTHFYLGIVAPAGTGKGVLAFTHTLLDATEDYYARIRDEVERANEAADAAWKQEIGEAGKQHRAPDYSRRPRPQKLPYFKLSATTSKSRLIESLAAAGDVGCAMATTEMATLTEAIGTDYGRFEDILLKACHHEEVSSSYKVDGRPIVARRPRLAVSLSGTPEQFVAFFRTTETGLYSRFAICSRPASVQWESCAPDDDKPELTQYYRTLGDELLSLHTLLLKSPTLVTFSRRQWSEHTAYFSRMLQSAHAEGRDALMSILFRHGLLVMRLAAILTCFRKCAEFPGANEYRCTDTDFHSAMLITQTVLEHSLLLSSSLPDSARPVQPLQKPHKLESLLAALPEKFSYSEFMSQAADLQCSQSTCKRMLRRALASQLVEKEEDGYRKTKTSTPE